MIPKPWEFALLTLAVFRSTRLLGWDVFPPIARGRAWLLRGRPLLGELFDCPFCLGWWIALGFYLAWLALPTPTLVLAVPLAIGAGVGLIAKNLDA